MKMLTKISKKVFSGRVKTFIENAYVSDVCTRLMKIFLPIIFAGFLYVAAFLISRYDYAGCETLALSCEMVKVLLSSLIILLGGTLLIEYETRNR